MRLYDDQTEGKCNTKRSVITRKFQFPVLASSYSLHQHHMAFFMVSFYRKSIRLIWFTSIFVIIIILQAANKQFICQNGIEGDKIRLSVKFNLLILYEKDEHKMYYYYLTKEKENTRTHTLRKFRDKRSLSRLELGLLSFQY